MRSLLPPYAAIPLSIDHKPERTDERQWIEQAGGFIIWAGKLHLRGLVCLHLLFLGPWVCL